ncbi:hypothetical protein [Luminiphilus sp. nBUS_07]|uniref:hypothetical protein n=1 Tax=Luminiphilus sp. nBUS_07 TaxID=3395314 RepID=UPI003EB6A0DC
MKKVFTACKAAVGANIPHTIGAWREGNPVYLVADATRAKSILGWQPYAAHIMEIVGSAWRW